ncbi:MAG: hypothetical protein QW117_02535 [Candidatus Pacearchaeota archaeon]
MKKIFLLIILSINLISLVYADCINSLDDYAIEILFNKQDITKDLSLLENAKNVNYINGNFIFKSSVSDNIALILKKVSYPFCYDCLSLRIQVPVNKTSEEVSFFEFSTVLKNKSLSFNESIFNNASSWDYECFLNFCSFYKENLFIYLDNSISNSTKINIEIYGEDIRDYNCDGKKVYYSTGVFCINNKNKEEIENLLKNLKIIDKVDELFLNYKIENSGKKIMEKFYPDLKSDFFYSLQKQNLTRNYKEDLSDIDWNLITEKEIRWIRFNNLITISNKDILEISNLAKLGYAGINKRIYYGEDDNGKKRWLYYYESKDAKLTKFNNCEDFSLSIIPKEDLFINYPKKGNINLYYLLPIIVTSILFLILIILIIIARKKFSYELEKGKEIEEEKEIKEENEKKEEETKEKNLKEKSE